MDSGKARELYLQYAGAMAYVAVRHHDGTAGLGSAFHVGEGVFVTARHVVENTTITEVATTEVTYVPLEGEAAKKAMTFLHTGEGEDPKPVHRVSGSILEVIQGPCFHRIPAIDVAVFKVRIIDPHTPAVPLGSHLDDWIGQNDFVMSEAIVLGYPPIPMTTAPHLVAARAEINAVVDLLKLPVHFILSSMPRGGFSGGLALSEYGFGLGVVTHSVMSNDAPAELGFMAVLGVESIFNCLADCKMVPETQREGWDGLWDEDWKSGIPGLDVE